MKIVVIILISFIAISCNSKYIVPGTSFLKENEVFCDLNYTNVLDWHEFLHFNVKTNTFEDSLAVMGFENGDSNQVILSKLSLSQVNKYMKWREMEINKTNLSPFDSLNYKTFCNPKGYKKEWEAYDKFDPKREKYVVFSLPPIEIAKTWKQPKELSGVYVEGDSVFYWNPNVKDNRIGFRSVARIVTK